MTLGDLIDMLKAADQQRVLPVGLRNPHSHRGDYHDLAFEPGPPATVAEVLAIAEMADGATCHGWKGGEYKMARSTDVYLAELGAAGEELGATLMGFMLGKFDQ